MTVPLQSIKIITMRAAPADALAPCAKLKFIARMLALLFATSPWGQIYMYQRNNSPRKYFSLSCS
ncbi:hypothetical protein [Janthinobacterium sp. GW458P]|uniref:hypothetical protein n=1 Tax=Janthinobacterium sp. GW458P TaxID=1981504 RepID=UPI00111E52B0|nr:hypothetical protein [Janthinobacterium sp. GW458P]